MGIVLCACLCYYCCVLPRPLLLDVQSSAHGRNRGGKGFLGKTVSESLHLARARVGVALVQHRLGDLEAFPKLL